MGSEGCVLVEGCTVNDHRNFEVKLFQNPNGEICACLISLSFLGAYDNDNDYPLRMVLSSYYWQGDSAGVPDGLSDCSHCVSQCNGCRTTKAYPAYDANSCGYDSVSYTRPHR